MTATDTRPALLHGVLDIGGVPLAFPLTLLREVVPSPAAFTPTTACAPGLRGSILLRRLVVPVVDLRERLGVATDDHDAQVIGIVVDGGRVLGVLADAVLGMLRVEHDAEQALEVRAGEAPLFPRCIVDGDGLGVVHLADAATVFGLPGVPSALDDRSVAAGRTAATLAAEGTTTLLLVDVAGVRLAFDATRARTVLPQVDLQPSVLDGELCRGTTTHLGSRIPVVDLLTLLGLGVLPAADVRQCIVLADQGGEVALAVSGVHEIVRAPDTSVRSLPPVGVHRPELLRGMWTSADGRHHLVLDLDAVSAHCDIAALAALNTSAPAGSARVLSGLGAGRRSALTREVDPGVQRAGHAFLAYDAGVEVVTLLGQVEEVLPFPSDVVHTTTDRPDVLGLFSLRGDAVPLVCLARLLGSGEPVEEAGTRVLVVSHADASGVSRRIGFAVAGLRAIETSSWEPDTLEVAAELTLGDLLANCPTVRIGGPTGPLVGHLDLHAVAARVLAPQVVVESLDDGDLAAA